MDIEKTESLSVEPELETIGKGFTLMPHQIEAIKKVSGKTRIAFYHDMGLGKTFTGAEASARIAEETGANAILIICQKSKIEDWIDHTESYYRHIYRVFDLTNAREYKKFISDGTARIGVMNYDILHRRPEILEMENFIFMLDESSLISNERSKRGKTVLELNENAKGVVLLSGTPVSGKYEKLWSQCQLLGWDIDKRDFYDRYIKFHMNYRLAGYGILMVDGYKNVPELKERLREHGAYFLKTEEVMDLPEKNVFDVYVNPIREYFTLCKHHMVTLKDGTEMIGDSPLIRMLYQRELCGSYNEEKLKACKDLLESTEDRVIIFYNYDKEWEELEKIVKELDRPISHINGKIKDLDAYENKENAVLLANFGAGSMGLNLQKCNRIIYFSPCISSADFEQSQKRIHRIGQEKPCFYYRLIVRNSIEEKIYKALQKRIDYTTDLFISDET